MASLQNSDFILVQRGSTTYKVLSSNLMAYLEDTDYVLINRSNQTYKISGADVRTALGGGNPLDPSLPPFGGLATTATTFTSSDSKIQFSLDATTYTSTLNVPINTFYYVDWGTDILTAAHGSAYSATIGVNFTSLNVTESIILDIGSIDKVPNAFSFTAEIDKLGASLQTSNIVSPLETINAPTKIWVTSTATNPQIRVGNGTWFTAPTTPGTAYVSQNDEVQVRHTLGTASSTAYVTTVNIGYGTGSGEFASAAYSTTTLNAYIDAPTITSPAANSANDINEVSITSDAITGTAFGSHLSSDWVIADDAGFSNVISSSYNDTTNLTSWTSTPVLNASARTVYLRVRYNSTAGQTSAWSSTIAISGQQWYRWQLVVQCDGGSGSMLYAHNGYLSNAVGGRGVVTLETTGTHATAPGSLEVLANYASGGSSNHNLNYGQNGHGGASSAAKLNGTVFIVSGGGGGSSNNGDGTNGSSLDLNGTSSANNGGTSSRSGGGAGGAAGVGGSSYGQPGTGGGGFGLAVNTVINNWKVISNVASLAPNRHAAFPNTSGYAETTLNRKYTNGGWSQIATNSGNYNGNVSAL